MFTIEKCGTVPDVEGYHIIGSEGGSVETVWSTGLYFYQAFVLEMSKVRYYTWKFYKNDRKEDFYLTSTYNSQ